MSDPASPPSAPRDPHGAVVPASAVGTARPGGRTARTRTAVLTAAREIVAETGEAAPSIPAVAERAGVHAATIYRRWRTAEALMVDVALDEVDGRSPVPATGDLRADLTTYAAQFIRDAGRPGGLVLLRALAAGATSPDAGSTDLARLAEPRMQEFRRLLDAGAARALEPVDLLDLLIAPVRLWAELGALPEDVEAAAARLADNAMAVDEHRRG